MSEKTVSQDGSKRSLALNGEKKSAFRRAMSRKKTVKIADDTKDSTGENTSGMSRGFSRGMSRKKSLRDKLARSKDEPVFGSRAKTGPSTLKAKQRVVEFCPSLAITLPQNKAEDMVLQGINSIRAEVIDFNAMLVTMQDNLRMLTHTAIERFFEWIPLFSVYLERYMLVEEDFVFKWIEKKADTLRGALKPSSRMVLRGKIQKQVRDIQDVQDEFMPHLPAGERLPKLVAVVESFNKNIEEYVTLLTTKLPELIQQHYDKGEIDKQRMRIVKHLVAHVGYQDFIALYTRWMKPGDLLEWKTTVLFPCDFKFFSYATWDKDMDYAHYKIASQFAEVLEDENKEAVELNKQSKADFERALASRREAEPLEEFEMDGLEVEATEEREYDE